MAVTICQQAGYADRFSTYPKLRYEELCLRHGELSCSYTYFLNSLSYMQSVGLVILVQTKVNRSYTSTVSLLFNVQVLETIFRMRFG